MRTRCCATPIYEEPNVKPRGAERFSTGGGHSHRRRLRSVRPPSPGPMRLRPVAHSLSLRRREASDSRNIELTADETERRSTIYSGSNGSHARGVRNSGPTKKNAIETPPFTQTSLDGRDRRLLGVVGVVPSRLIHLGAWSFGCRHAVISRCLSRRNGMSFALADRVHSDLRRRPLSRPAVRDTAAVA